jgi:hypothetical protein
MNANLTFAMGGFLHRTRLILVNDRIPRTDGHCAAAGLSSKATFAIYRHV